MSVDVDERVERVRTALVGLAPEQSETLVRMVELGAMICLVDAAPNARPFIASRDTRRRGRRPRPRTSPHAGAA